MDYLIASAAKRYFKFTAAWRSSLDLPYAPIFVLYEDFFRYTEAGQTMLSQDLGLPHADCTAGGLSEEEQQSKRVCFNVGHLRRGAQILAEHQKARSGQSAQLKLAKCPVALPQVLSFEKS